MRRWVMTWAIVMVMSAVAGCQPPNDTPLPTVMQLPTDSPPSPTAPPSDAPAQPLPYNQAVSDTLDRGEAKRWVFDAQRGDTVQVRVVSDSVTPRLTLTAADGTGLADGQTSLEAVIPADGVYTLTVQADSGTGSYDLGLTSAQNPAAPPPTLTPVPVIVGVPTPTPAPVAEGTFLGVLADRQTSAGEFALSDGAHLYSFDAPATGGVARLQLTRVNGATQPLMALLDPSGVVVAVDMFSDNGSGALLQNIPLEAGGTYTVRLDGAGNPGTYTLRLDLSAAPVPLTPTIVVTPTSPPQTPVLTPSIPVAERGVRLSPNAPVADRIAEPFDLNTHSFYAQQGDTLAIGVAPVVGSGLSPQIELIDPDGNIVGTAVGGTTPLDRDALITGLVVPLEGAYTVYVTGQNGTVGDYVVSFGGEGARFEVMRGEIAPDQAVTANFQRRAAADVWYMYLNAGDVVTGWVLPLDSVVAPVLELVREDGALLGLDRDSGGDRAPQINGVRVTQSGYHYWRVRPADPNQLGTYQLTWRYLDFAPTPTPPAGTVPLVTVNGTVAPEAYAFVPFYGRAGEVVRVYVNAPVGGTLDPVAALIAPDGQTIGGGDDLPNSMNVQFEATLPADGTYQVRVSGYLSGGEYVLYVERLFR
jgi:hypothetical protein